MGLLCSTFLCLLLARISTCRVFQEGDHPDLRLPLYHVRGGPNSLRTSDDPQSLSDELALDNDRVAFLNSRLNGRNLTSDSSVLTGSEGFDDEKSANVPLNSGISIGIGNYYTKIGLGTPPTYYDVVMDTGSSFSWIQCEPCVVYCHPQAGSRFNPSASGSYQKLSCATSQCSSLKVATLNSPMCSASATCIYSATYGDQSFSIGYLSKDSLQFGSQSVPGFVFGCGQDNRGLFGKSGGLIGLGKNQLSLLSQLSAGGGGKSGKFFSYCLPTSSLTGQTGGGGYLSIGTPPNSAHISTPMLADPRDPTLYFLKLTAITIYGKQLTVPPSGYSSSTIIDSGTVISRLSSPLYSALSREFAKIVSAKFKTGEPISILDTCFHGTFDEISKVTPPVELIFQGGGALKLAAYNVILGGGKGHDVLGLREQLGHSHHRQQTAADVRYFFRYNEFENWVLRRRLPVIGPPSRWWLAVFRHDNPW